MTDRVLVTGGAGFIGSHLVRHLLATGEEVVVLDDLSSGSAANLDPRACFLSGDVTDSACVAEAVKDVASIFHLAARVSVQECIADWAAAHRVNLGGTITLFQAAVAAGKVPVVYASSAAVYGDHGRTPCREDDCPAPISPYGADKLAAEHQARAMAAVHGLPSVGLRLFNVYGPGQAASSPYAGVIARFVANRRADRPFTVFGDGRQSRDFIAVADVVEGLLAARDHARDQSGAGVFNLCTGTETTLLALAEVIDAAARRGSTPIVFAPPQAGDIAASLGATEQARTALGFSARTTLTAGIQDLWEATNAGDGAANGSSG